jgi:hypothetical protein
MHTMMRFTHALVVINMSYKLERSMKAFVKSAASYGNMTAVNLKSKTNLITPFT